MPGVAVPATMLTIASLTFLDSFFSALTIGARGCLRGGEVLVDVDADGVDAGVTGCLQHAVAGEAGDLEHDVDVGILRQQLLREGLAARRIGEGSRIRLGRDIGDHDLDVRVHRQRTLGVALDVVDDGRDDRGAADGADVTGLADRGRHDAGEVAGLLLAPVDADVVLEALGHALVDADELDVGVGLCRVRGVLTSGEADRHDDVVLLVDEGLDVGGDVRGRLADGELRLGGADGLSPGLRAFPGVLVEVAVVDRADVRDEADLQI